MSKVHFKYLMPLKSKEVMDFLFKVVVFKRFNSEFKSLDESVFLHFG